MPDKTDDTPRKRPKAGNKSIADIIQEQRAQDAAAGLEAAKTLSNPISPNLATAPYVAADGSLEAVMPRFPERERHDEVIERLDTINASLQELNASMQQLIGLLSQGK